jgi:hypothetical protein
MFAVLRSDINSLTSGLLHLTDQPYCKKSRSAKVKDEIINLILGNYLVDRYTRLCLQGRLEEIREKFLSVRNALAYYTPVLINIEKVLKFSPKDVLNI